MKISIKQYSQSLFELTDEKSEQEIFDVVKKFAEKLKDDGQLKNSSKIIEKYSELHDAANGIIKAEVITASDMLQEAKDKLVEMVKEKYSAKEVVVKNVIDKKIKGGIIIRVGDEVMDGSIAMQLKKLKKELVK